MVTVNQKRVMNEGYVHRVAAPIRRKNENGNMYDLSHDLKMQFHYFPFGGEKDAIDALSRIYDMEVRAPNAQEPSYLEPAYT